LRKNLDCFVVIAPRNDGDTGARERRENDFIYPPPHEVRGRGTTRRVVEGAYGVEASLEADAPSTTLLAQDGPLPRFAGQDEVRVAGTLPSGRFAGSKGHSLDSSAPKFAVDCNWRALRPQGKKNK
jgi:hypothetical protein